MAKVTLKINGLDIEAEQGSTILQAAKQAGIFIPTLCYHPYLPLEEACRICVVEEVRGGWSSLVAACVYPVRNGMIVETDSEMVVQARQTIIDLLLSNHPTDCMTCYATGKCELQDFAFMYGISAAKYKGETSDLPVDSDPSPYLHIDMNKCILCRRCVRACHEIQGADIWGKSGRGFHQRISTAYGDTLEVAGCENCGHCADFCPVDAIGFRGGRGTIRSWELQDSSTVCLQCACGCRATYQKIGDKIIRVTGDFSSPVSVGALCKKGRFNFDFINSPERITQAAVRVNGELDPMPVDNALQFAALGFNDLKKNSGGADVIGVICGDMLTNEEYYLAQKLARAGLGTNNIDSVPGPWQQAVYSGLKAGFGDGLIGNPMSGIANAKSVLVLGSNTIEKHAIAALKARKAARDNAVLIVANPDPVPLKKTASMYLPVEGGAEDALVKGLIKAIVEDKLAEALVEGEVGKNFKKALKSIKSTPWKEISEKTGLSDNVIREAARLYANSEPAVLVYGVDPATSPVNENFYYTCCLLQQLVNTANPSRNTIFVLGSAGNAQGAAEFGALPGYLPGFNTVGSAVRKTASKVWGAELPNKQGMSWPEMFSAIERGSLKGLYLIGVDPYQLGMPEQQVREALDKLEFLVVEDTVHNRASEAAHLVLPASSFVEKDGTAINSERRMQLLQRALASPGDAQSDFDLLNGLLEKLNPELKAESRTAVLQEAIQFIPDLGGVAFDQITADGVILGKDNAGSEIKAPEPVADPAKAAGASH